MKLIDADALGICFAKREVFKVPEYADGWNAVMTILENAPSVDAVPVVRCKDCSAPHNCWTGCPNIGGKIPPSDFYCAAGERKEGAKV